MWRTRNFVEMGWKFFWSMNLRNWSGLSQLLIRHIVLSELLLWKVATSSQILQSEIHFLQILRFMFID